MVPYNLFSVSNKPFVGYTILIYIVLILISSLFAVRSLGLCMQLFCIMSTNNRNYRCYFRLMILTGLREIMKTEFK